MSNKYRYILVCAILLILNSCLSNNKDLMTSYHLNDKNIDNYSLKDKEVLFLVDYYYSPYKITDTCIIFSVAYAIEEQTGDTIRILCTNGTKKYPSRYLEFTNDKEAKMLIKNIYLNNDSILIKKNFKTVIGKIKFLNI